MESLAKIHFYNIIQICPSFNKKSFVLPRTRKNSKCVKKAINIWQQKNNKHIRIIWQKFSGSYAINASMRNYEHVWNKWKYREPQEKNRYSKEIEDIKDQMGILELKNIITKIKELSGWTQQHNGRNKRIS